MLKNQETNTLMLEVDEPQENQPGQALLRTHPSADTSQPFRGSFQLEVGCQFPQCKDGSFSIGGSQRIMYNPSSTYFLTFAIVNNELKGRVKDIETGEEYFFTREYISFGHAFLPFTDYLGSGLRFLIRQVELNAVFLGLEWFPPYETPAPTGDPSFFAPSEGNELTLTSGGSDVFPNIGMVKFFPEWEENRKSDFALFGFHFGGNAGVVTAYYNDSFGNPFQYEVKKTIKKMQKNNPRV